MRDPTPGQSPQRGPIYCIALGELSNSVPGDTLLKMSRVCPFYESRTREGAKHQIKRGSDKNALLYWSIGLIAMPRQALKAKNGSVAGQQGHAPDLRLLHGALFLEVLSGPERALAFIQA